MSDPVYEAFLTVQDTVAGHIQAIDYLHGHEVITERKGDMPGRIATALSKLGLSIVVVTPSAKLLRVAHNRQVWELKLVVDVAESALINRSKHTGKPALAAATAIAVGISGQPNGLPASQAQRGENVTLTLDPEMPLMLVPDPRQVIYHVTAATHVFITVPPPSRSA
ncbi:hypothetical protein H5P28_00320 [Ruficoccus amylovorans]|uniref:Uncharacterized protein n=1 Tax=Ruficoccus amylovorans TaxID=1804625 RepID=A0A842HAE3_9BACT|nr:hypothetical protein [Ruficoccus amylovorans]MBC2592696.1 hypothetical protein [Ruficoccus amylovorans]